MAIKFYTKVKKGLKLKVRKFWLLILTSAEVKGEKLVEEAFLPLLPPDHSPLLSPHPNQIKPKFSKLLIVSRFNKVININIADPL